MLANLRVLLFAGLYAIGLLQLAIPIRRAALGRLALLAVAIHALRPVLILVAPGFGSTVLIPVARSLLVLVTCRALGFVLVSVASSALSPVLVLVATLRPVLVLCAGPSLRPPLVALAALRLGAGRPGFTSLSALRRAALAGHAARGLTAVLGAARSATASVHLFRWGSATHATHAAAHTALVRRLSQCQRPGAKQGGERYR